VPTDDTPLQRLLAVQLRLLPLVVGGLGVLLLANLTLGRISLFRAALGLLIGAVMGAVLNRVQRISWSDQAERVIATVNAAGLLALATFFVLVSLRAFFALRFSTDLYEAAVVGMATAVGVMSMRFRGLRRRIRRALKTLEPPRR
jgi:HAMP domain-containing protein